MTADVFISFASKDVKVAMTLCKALESRGFNCWVSARDIQAGENFQVAIVQAIRKAKLMLLVFTGNSNTSEEMTKELALASQQRKIVIPLRVEDVAPSDAFAYEFATRQWIDFFANWETAVELLAKRIAHALAEPAHVHDTAEAYAAVVLADNGDTLVADPVAKAPVAKAPPPPAPPPVGKASPKAEITPPPAAPDKAAPKVAPAPVVKPQASAPPAGKPSVAGASAQAEPGVRNPAKARTLAIVAVVVVVIAAAMGLAGALMRSGPTTTAKVAAPTATVNAAPVVPLPPPPPGGYPVAPQVAGAPLPTDTTLLPVVPVKPVAKKKAAPAPAADGPKDDILF